MFRRMKITIRLADNLVQEAEKQAADTRRTLDAVLDDALREFLARHSTGKKRKPVQLRTVKGDGLWPGVDLDAGAALIDVIEPKDRMR